MVASGNLALCVDARVLSEYRGVLERPKFGLDHDRIAAIIDYIEHHSRVVASVPLSHSLPDPDDEPFFEIAVSGGADYLVTGNAVHFPSKYCQGVEVVSPSAFLERGVKRRGRRA
jgi:predicted nucleic acid-binding protein